MMTNSENHNEDRAFTIDYVNFLGSYIKGIHTQSTWELTYVEVSGGHMIIGHDTEAIESGMLVLIPPGIPHGWKFPDNKVVSAISLFFTSDTLERIAEAIPETGECVRSILKQTSVMIYDPLRGKRIGRNLKESAFENNLKRIPAVLSILLDISDFSDGRVTGEDSHKSPVQRKMDMIAAFVRSNFQKNITLGETAEVLKLNKTSLCAFIRRNIGMTFSEFVNKHRLESAQHLLRTTELPVAQIAYEVGLSSGSYLNRIFKRAYGVSPRAFRKHHSQDI